MAPTDPFDFLPPETRARILGFLDRHSLVAATQASQALHGVLTPQAMESSVCRDLLKGFDEGVLPIAIALYHAENTNWEKSSAPDGTNPEEWYEAKVAAFCDENLRGAHYDVADVRHVNVAMTIRILDFDEAAEEVAQLLAVYVGKGIEQDRTPTEWLRIRKCVYIYELARIVIGQEAPTPDRAGRVSMPSRCFWSCFAPWEASGIRQLEIALDTSMVYATGLPSAAANPTANATAASQLELYLSPWGVEWCRSIWHGDITLLVGNSRGDRGLFRRRLLSAGLQADYSLWDERMKLNVKKTLEVVRHYDGAQHAGPRDLFLWSQIIHRLEPSRPLHAMKGGWSSIIRYCDFGRPDMDRYCFQDRPNLEAMFPGKYPTMEALLAEAEALLAEDEALSARDEAFLAEIEAVLAETEVLLAKTEAFRAKVEAWLAEEAT
ncbi:hypothetical protein F5Y13DRAFT_194562 [Hypoxylon sp. FL1857]|nr:hypothetical protein F5Y13DRAFT_194562 [Hypoxylon sp. FL1857]